MEGMCPSCLYQGAWNVHAYDSADGGLVGRLVFMEVSTTREKVSGGKECMQGGPSTVVRGSKGGT